MADEDKKFSRQIIGKTVVSKTGKRFGEVGDIVFETGSGELIHVVLRNPTPYSDKLELEKNKEGEYDLVMRTQTSPVQIRAMQKYGAPLKAIIPGRCFRSEATDVRHEHTLYQFSYL